MKKTALCVALFASIVSASAVAQVSDGQLQSIADAALHAAKLSPTAHSVDAKNRDGSFDLVLAYSSDVDAQQDLRIYITEFIHRLVAAGADPSGKTFIHVCARQTGLKTVTGKPGAIALGCEHYNKFTDSLRYDPPQ